MAETNSGGEDEANNESNFLFDSMTSNRLVLWIFLLFFPILWTILIAVGWGKEDIIETDVNAIWTKQRGAYKANLDYAEQFNEGALGDLTSFAAMAVARDGGNLFTPERLETIRQRMEEVEKTVVRSDRFSRVFFEVTYTGAHNFPRSFCV